MKMRICLAVVLTVALLVGGFSGNALATCERTVKVIRVISFDTSFHHVYGQELYQVFPGYVWVWYIANDDVELLGAAQAAYVSGAPTVIRGDAVFCPSTGGTREGGTVDAIGLFGK